MNLEDGGDVGATDGRLLGPCVKQSGHQVTVAK
jgi:hypothetical protein